MEPFWPLVKDLTSKTLEVQGRTTNDTLITDNIIALKMEGFNVLVELLPYEPTKDEVLLPGFTREKGLYHRLLDEYERKTGRYLKKW